jgi:hypothetical protein
MAKSNSMGGSIAPSGVRIEPEQIEAIREVLLIGLASFGEIERLSNAVDIEEDICRRPVPKEFHPIHPTGSADTVCKFADALRSLDTIAWAICNKQEVVLKTEKLAGG